MAKKKDVGVGRGRKLDPEKVKKALELASELQKKGDKVKISVIAKEAKISNAACKRLLIQNGFSIKRKGAGKILSAGSAPALKGKQSNLSSALGAILTVRSLPEDERILACEFILSKKV